MNELKLWFSRKNIQIAVFATLLVFFGALIIYKITLPAAEDLPRQMMNGKDILSGNFDVLYKNVYSYTDTNHAFANHHWLYGVFAYLLYLVGGFEGVVIFKVALFLFAFWLLFKIALKKASFWNVAIFSIPTIIMISGRSSARPEMFSYLFTVLYLYILTRFEEDPKGKYLFWLIPIQILWANIHILFPAGVAIIGAFWVSLVVRNWKGAVRNPVVQKLTFVLFAVTIVSFINPFGIKGVIYSLSANTVGATKIFSAEVQSIASVFRSEPKVDYLGPWIFQWMVWVLGASFVIGYKKRNIAYGILAFAFAVLSFRIIRGVPMFALVFLPAVTSNFEEGYRRIVGWITKRWGAVATFCFSLLKVFFICSIIFGLFFFRDRILPYQEFGIGLTKEAEEPIDFFKKNDLSGPIFNDTDLGSYLIWYLYPEEKVFADNRFADAYSKEFLEGDYSLAFKDQEGWEQVLKKYNFKVIMVNHYNRGSGMVDFIYNRIYDPGWVWVYAGRDTVIFVRNIPEYKRVIEKYAITQDNFIEKMQPLVRSSDYRGRVAAADLFNYTGNTKLAITQYERLVSDWPSVGKIWFIIGRSELLRSDQANSNSARALLALQQAIKKGYKTPYSYSYLALAYYRLGDIDQAEWAVEQELKIDPESKDGNAWKDILLKERLRMLNATTPY